MSKKCLKCNKKVVDWKTNLCHDHLITHIEDLKKLSLKWEEYFTSGYSIRKPLDVVEGIFVDEINNVVIGWTSFENQKYEGRKRRKKDE